MYTYHINHIINISIISYIHSILIHQNFGLGIDIDSSNLLFCITPAKFVKSTTFPRCLHWSRIALTTLQARKCLSNRQWQACNFPDERPVNHAHKLSVVPKIQYNPSWRICYTFGIRDQGHLCFIKGNTSNAKIWKVEATSFLAKLFWLQDIGQQTAGTPAASAPCRDLAKIQIKEKRQPTAFYNMRGEESLLRAKWASIAKHQLKDQ